MPCLFYFGLKASQHFEARPFILASFSFLVHLGFLTQKGSRWIAVDLPPPSGGSLPNLSPHRVRVRSSSAAGGSLPPQAAGALAAVFPSANQVTSPAGGRVSLQSRWWIQRAAGGATASCPVLSCVPCARSTLGRAGLGGRQTRRATAGGFW